MNSDSKRRLRKIGFVSFGATILLSVSICVFAWNNPLIFNESFFGHAHCIKQATLELRMLANGNNGKFPSHTNGYADAVMSINSACLYAYTGPGYSADTLKALSNGKVNVPESELGRVYVQGLDADNDPKIAMLFDKLPTPGGDHCHGFSRLWAPLAREVGFLDGSVERILEKDWERFSREQISLLVLAGVSKETAESYYAEQPKPDLAALAKKYR